MPPLVLVTGAALAPEFGVRMPFRTDSARDGWTALDAAQRAGFRAVFLITTNLMQRRNGTAVMGAGLALSAVQRRPGIDARYGEALRRGERVFLDRDLVCFPSKDDWRTDSDPELIAQSARALIPIVLNHAFDFVLVPHVGARNGHLDWLGLVRPLLEREFAPGSEAMPLTKLATARCHTASWPA